MKKIQSILIWIGLTYLKLVVPADKKIVITIHPRHKPSDTVVRFPKVKDG